MQASRTAVSSDRAASVARSPPFLGHKNSNGEKNESNPVFSLKSLSEEMSEVHLISPRTDNLGNNLGNSSDNNNIPTPSLASLEEGPSSPNAHKGDTMDAALMLTSMRDLISKEISVLGAKSPFLPSQTDLDVRSSPRRMIQKYSLPVISPRASTPSFKSQAVARTGRSRSSSVSLSASASLSASSNRARTVSMDSPALPKAVNTSQYEKLFASPTTFSTPRSRSSTTNTMDYNKSSPFSAQPDMASFVAISPPSSPKLSPQSVPLLSVPSLREPTSEKRKASSSEVGFGLHHSPRKRQAQANSTSNNNYNNKKGLRNKKLIKKEQEASSSRSSVGVRSAKPDRVLKKKFSWKNYPELEHFLIANREEYLRHSALNYTMQQKQYNNRLTERLLKLADDSGYAFDEDDFSFVTVRDRIRCYFKSYVQSRKKRGVIIGYAARRAGLLTEEELEKSASVKGRIVVPSIEKKSK